MQTHINLLGKGLSKLQLPALFVSEIRHAITQQLRVSSQVQLQACIKAGFPPPASHFYASESGCLMGLSGFLDPGEVTPPLPDALQAGKLSFPMHLQRSSGCALCSSVSALLPHQSTTGVVDLQNFRLCFPLFVKDFNIPQLPFPSQWYQGRAFLVQFPTCTSTLSLFLSLAALFVSSGLGLLPHHSMHSSSFPQINFLLFLIFHNVVGFLFLSFFFSSNCPFLFSASSDQFCGCPK